MRYIPMLHTKQSMKLLVKYCLVVIWMGIIFLLSAEGADDSRARSGAVVGILKDSLNTDSADDFLTSLTRKAAHIVAYFILGILIYSIIETYKLTGKRTIVLSITFALLYAIFDEIHQLFVPGRSGEIRDVLIDTVAASIGVGIYYTSSKIRRNHDMSKGKIRNYTKN